METVGVELSKSYRCGYVLTESELRRLVAIAEEQLAKAHGDQKPVTTFTLGYHNGALAETSSIEEVLREENTGSARIVRLKMKSEVGKGRGATRIITEFLDPQSGEEDETVSIRHRINGKTRDWVFVTSSLVEERITKVKRFAVNQLFSRRSLRFFGSLSVPLIFMLSVVIALPTIGSRRQATVQNVKQLWTEGKLKDPIEALVMLQQGDPQYDVLGVFTPAIYIFTGLLILLGCYYLILRYYPMFNMCWGDYLHEFNRKESRRKFVLGGILLALIISIVGSLIANSLGLLKF
jgi:hypothetical protein